MAKQPTVSSIWALVRTSSAVFLVGGALLAPCPALPQQLPTGGTVTHGNASIGTPQAGTLNINQTSNRAIIDWNSFSVGAGGRVNFNQPSSSAATLNRVTGTTSSTIAGAITAPGTVLLVNPNGIAITPTGTVNVGSFAASTLDIKNGDFLAGNYKFSGNGSSATVTNAGRINVSDGGFAALLGGRVANDGIITARLGRVGLGSGEKITLDLAGDGFLSVEVPSNQLGNLVDGTGQALVSNRGKIRADGGIVHLSAATANAILRDAVNVPGSIRANSISTRGGRIVLGGGAGGRVTVSGRISASGTRTTRRQPAAGGQIDIAGAEIALSGARLNASGAISGGRIRIGGDYQGTGDFQRAQRVSIDSASVIRADATEAGNGGTVIVWSDGLTSVSGTFSARGGANGGNGGLVETSGHELSFNGVRVDTSAPRGKTGDWLLDPVDLTIDTAAAATISANLAGANVTILTDATSASGPGVQTAGNGDIFINAAITWTSANTLTFNAYRDIHINASITGGAGARVVLRADTTGTGSGTVAFDNAAARITATGGVSVTYNPTSYATPTDFGPYMGAGTTATSWFLVNTLDQLQSVVANGNYLLTHDIDATATSGWNGGAGFSPIALSSGRTFDGQGHTISNLTIIRPTTTNVALFSTSSGTIQNLNVSGGSVRGQSSTAGLVGVNNGAITGSSANISISGISGSTGGLVGINNGTIDTSYANGPVVATGTATGGLVGTNNEGRLINRSFATGSVWGVTYVGGLVGENKGSRFNGWGTIWNSFASGNVAGSNTAYAGGVVGLNWGNLSNIFASGSVSGRWSGGLVGLNIGDLTPNCGLTPSCTLQGGRVEAAYWNTSAFGGNWFGSWSDPGAGVTNYSNQITATGLNRAQLQASVPAGLANGNWAIIPGVSFPYLVAIFPTAPLVVSGYAAIDNGPQPYRSQDLNVNVDGYATWASADQNGYFYTLMNRPVAGAHRVIINTLGDYAGVRYDQAWSGQITGFDVWGQAVRARTSDATLSAMANTIAAALQSAGSTRTSIDNYRNLEVISTASNFLLDRAINVNSLVVGSAGLVTSPTAYGLQAGQFSIASGGFHRVAGGDGTIGDPYQITDVYGLQGVGSTASLLSANYLVTNNIDASGTINWNSGAGFVPIGTGLGAFTGSLRGSLDAYGVPTTSISFLTIVRPSTDYVGLISRISSSSTGGVANLTFILPTVVGGNYVGTVTGENLNNGFGLSVVQGSVTGGSYVGGLMGVAARHVNNDSFSGTVAGSGDYVGGLVGSTTASISQGSNSGTVSGRNYVGGLAGLISTTTNSPNSTPTVLRSYSTSDVAGVNYVGGLIGSNGLFSTHTLGAGVITSFATGDVTGSDYVGGLIGYNAGVLTATYATGNVTASNSLNGTGGLVGYNVNLITQSYATGNVSAIRNGSTAGTAGGLVGQQGAAGAGSVVSGADAGITYSYATGNVYGSQAGGLIGILQLANPGGITQNWSSGRSTRDGANGGGFLGMNAGFTGTLASNYWDTESSGLGNAMSTDVVGIGAPVGLTTAQALNSASYAGWDFNNIWTRIGNSRPFLQSEFFGPTVTDPVYGTTTRLIGSSHQLAWINTSIQNLFGNYRLVSDIRANEFTSAGMYGSVGFMPIGPGTDPNSRFIGVFDGGGHVIDGLRIYLPSTNNVGLFGFINENARVFNLGITNASVTGYENVGILAGSSVGSISASYTSGNATGYNNVGGLLGYNIGNDAQNGGGAWGSVDRSYSAATVSALNVVGDPRAFPAFGLLVGRNGDTGDQVAMVTNSYTLGASNIIIGAVTSGSLVGANFGGIETSYAVGGSNGLTFMSGLVGLAVAGSYVSSSYYNSDHIRIGTGDGTPLTTAQMQDLANIATNFAGFDFANVWSPPNQAGQDGQAGTATAHLPGLYAIDHVIFVNLAGASMTYGDNTASYNSSVSGLRDSDAATPVSLVRDLAFGSSATSTTAAGTTFSVTACCGRATSLDGSAYRFVYLYATGTVAQRAITVTADNVSRVYGAADPTLTYTVTSGSLVNNDGLSGALSRDAGSNVGTYAINQGSLSANSNYVLTYQPGGTLRITPATLTYVADLAGRTYGDANAVFGGSVTGFVNGDTLLSATTGTLSFTSAATASTAVGQYRIDGSGLSAGNYVFQQAAGNATALTINRRDVTVTANAATREYGLANPALTYMTSDLGVGGTAVTGALTTSATQASNVGQYAIQQGTVSNANGANSNYNISYVDANLTISQAELTFTADSATRAYGNVNPALDGQVTGFRNGQSAQDFGGGVWSTTATATSNVGSYLIEGSLNGASNYRFTQAAGNASALTIERRNVLVSATAASRYYGDNNPGLSFTTSDLGAGIAVAGNLAVGANPTSNVGRYAIGQGSVTTATNTNYNISYAGADLTINPRPVTVTANDLIRTYGDANPALTFRTSSLGAGIAIAGILDVGANATSNVGRYAIGQGTVTNATNANYDITYVGGNLTINPATLVFTANSATRTYGATNPALGGQISGFRNGETAQTFGGDLWSTEVNARTNVGRYAITGGLAGASPNYTVVQAAGNATAFAITPAPVVVTANGGTSVYGASPRNPGLSATGLQNGEGVEVLTGLSNSFGISQASRVTGSPYLLSVNGALTNPNYQVTARNVGSWYVTPASITVTANDLSRLQSERDPQLTWRVTQGQLFNGDQLSGELVRAPGLAPGFYAISRGTLAASESYTLAFVGGILEIKAIPIENPSQSRPTSTPTSQVGGPPTLPGDTTTITFQPVSAPPVTFGTSDPGTSSTGASAPGGPRKPTQTDPVSTTTDPAVTGTLNANHRLLSYLPISQFEAREYSTGRLPGYEDRTGEATVLTMIARAIGSERTSTLFIDNFWNANASAAEFDLIAQRVTFSNGDGKKVDPEKTEPFALRGNDPAKLLRSGPLMIVSTDPNGGRSWMLAIRTTEDGKGIIANDPATGRQVTLAYDPQTRAIGGVRSVLDPKTNTFVAIDNTEALKAAGLDILAERVTALQTFAPTGYLAVGVN